MDVFTAKYENEGLIYSVDGNTVFNGQLQSDHNYAAEYCNENAAATEVLRVAEAPESEQQDFQWNKRSTALLVHLYKERILRFRDPKQKKKFLWMEIVHKLFEHGYKGLTYITVDKKFRNMKKTFRTIKENNKKTANGRGRIAWEYFDDFSEIFQDDRPSIPSMPTSSSVSSFTPSSCESLAPSQPSTPYTLLSPLTISTTSVSSPPLPTNVSVLRPCQFDRNEKLKAPFTSSSATQTKVKKFNELRKKQLELEERRLEELRRLRESVERSNDIQLERYKLQLERNNLLKEILEKL